MACVSYMACVSLVNILLCAHVKPMSDIPDKISKEDQAAIDQAFPPEVSEVYIVHTGTFSNTSGSDQGLAGSVCTRLVEREAKDIAQMLNEAQEGVMFLKWAASVCFPDIKGGREELEEAISTAEVIDGWEKLAAPHRKEIYRVAHLKVQGEADIKKLNEELADVKK
jgi:hypothetical protein